MRIGLILGLLFLLEPPAYGSDARARRAARDQAIASLGENAKDFVETWGNEAVAAVNACSHEVGLKLAEFHASGGFGKLPRPRDLLVAISKPDHGDEVATWAIEHATELADADALDAYLHDPLSYALSLKKLEDGAKAVREYRTAFQERKASTASYRLKMIGLGGAVTLVGGLLVWRIRQSKT